MLKGHRFIVETITGILGENVKILLFGSRATEKHRKFSDVDIAIDAVSQITLEQRIEIKNSFEESSYPYKIDIIDLNNKPDYFDIGNFKQLYPIKCTEPK